MAVNGHHDHGNSYTGEYLSLECRFRGLVHHHHWEETWWHEGRQGSRGTESSKSGSVGSRKRERERDWDWFKHLKPQSPPPVTHFI